MKIWNCIIVGAGASGMYLASRIELPDVMIIEKNNSIGKKLLVTGGGACNITHDALPRDFYSKYSNKKSFVKKALYTHNAQDVIKYLNSIGLDIIVQDDNRVFPKSKNSVDLLKTLHSQMKERVEIRLNERLLDIEYDFDKSFFEIITSRGRYITKKLVLAMGGKSYSHTGSTGDGYEILEKLNHTITKLRPALASIHTYEDFSFLSGLSFEDVELKLYDENMKSKFKKAPRGDLLFTHIGISGPLVLNNSRYFEKDNNLEINFTNFDFEKLDKYILDLIELNPKSNLNLISKSLKLPIRFFEYILCSSDINLETKLSDLKKADRIRIVKFLTSFSVKIKRIAGFSSAMVTSGGVSTSEINSKNMQSKIIDGLYVLGELLDVDGDSGGYNIQWAFSSAEIARLDIENA